MVLRITCDRHIFNHVLTQRCVVITDLLVSVGTVDSVDVKLADIATVISELVGQIAVPAEMYRQVPE